MSKGSEVPQGSDWWLASDGRWYPPQPALVQQVPQVPPPPSSIPQYQSGQPSQQFQQAQFQQPQQQVPQYQHPYPQQPPFPTQPAKSNGCLKAFLIVFGILVVLGIIGAVLLGFAAKKVVDEIEKGSRLMKSSEVSVKQASCQLNEAGVGEARGTITNKTKVTQAFSVRTPFKAGGVTYEEVDVVSAELAPGDTYEYVMSGTIPKTGTIACDVKVYATILDNFSGLDLDTIPTIETIEVPGT